MKNLTLGWEGRQFTTAALRALDVETVSRLSRASTWADGAKAGALVETRVLPVNPLRVTDFGRILHPRIASLGPIETFHIADALCESTHEAVHAAGGCPHLPIGRERIVRVIDELEDEHGVDALRLLLAVGADRPVEFAETSEMPARSEAVSILVTDPRLRMEEWAGWPVPDAPDGLLGPDDAIPVELLHAHRRRPGIAREDDGATEIDEELPSDDDAGASWDPTVDPVDSSSWAAVLRLLHERLEGVRVATRRVADRVEAGAVPDEESLAEMRGFRELLDRMADLAVAQGMMDRPAETLDELELAIEAARAREEARGAAVLDEVTAEVLARLARGLEGSEDLAEALAEVAAQAARIVGTDDLTTEDLDLAAGLGRVGGLIAERADGGDVTFEQVSEVRSMLPTALHGLLRAIPYGEVRHRADVSDDGREDGDVVGGPVVEEAAEAAEGSDGDAAPGPVAPTPEVTPERAVRAPRARPDRRVEGRSEAPGSDDADRAENVSEILAESIRAGAFGLAAHIADTTEGSRIAAPVLRAIALATAMRSGTGSAAAAYRREVEGLALTDLAGERGLQLLALAGAVRASIVAPYMGATDILNGLAPTADDSEVSELLHQLAIYEGVVPAIASERAVIVQDRVQLDRAIADAARACRDLAERVQNYTAPFQRATRVWRYWAQPEGLLGMLLATAGADDRTKLALIAERISRLADRRDVEALLDQTDEELSGRHREGIIATAREWTLRKTEEVIEAVRTWHEAASEASGDGPADDIHGSRFQHLQSVVRSSRQRTLAWLESQQDGASPIDAACVAAATAHLEVSFRRIVDLERIPGPEVSADSALNMDLIRAVRVPLDGAGRPRGAAPLSPEVLTEALRTSWRAAFDARDREGNHAAAAVALQQIEAEGREVPDLTELREAHELRLEEGRAAVARGFAGCESAFARARLHRHIVTDSGDEDEEEAELLALRLEMLAPPADIMDVATLRVAQQEFLAELDLHLGQARDRLRLEFAERRTESPQVADIEARFERNVEVGELDTARELLSQAAAGTIVPELPDLGALFASFHPRVVDEVAAGRLTELNVFRASKSGTVEGPLDFSDLSNDERDGRVLPALSAWSQLRALADASKQSERVGAVEEVRKVVSLLGLVPRPGQGAVERDRRAAQDRDLTWFRLPPMEPRVERRVPVPQFGSVAGGAYRVLVGWSSPKMTEVIERIRANPERTPVLVLYPGVLDTAARSALRREAWRAQTPTPFIVVDDAVMFQLAALGRGFLTDALELTLPFTALDPYMPDAIGNLPPELFYGRDRELESLQDKFGSHFIYGGRQFGKSVLLRAAQRNFPLRGDGHVAIYEDLKARGLGVNRGPSDLVDVLGESLRAAGIEVRRPRARDMAADDLVEDLRLWCAGEPGRRLLILLDEADDFLESDSPRFATVQFIKRLFDATDRRVKPVLAGLHQVQRFTKVDSNNPFAHLGEHLRIGSLAPGAAQDLLLRPLAAVGLRFADDDLVARVLGRTNFQPASIHLMGKAVIRYAHGRAGVAGGSPMELSSRDVDEILSDEQLALEIRKRFDLTMALDQRYRIITYTMAYNAHESGANVRYTAADLYDQCRGFAPDGFAGLGSEDFALLVGELVDLGVLATDRSRRTFAVRSPNILRLLGDGPAIEDELLRAAELELQPRYDLSLFRRLLNSSQTRRSPLAERRLMQIVASGAAEARTHVFLASALLSGELVLETVKEVAKDAYGSNMTWRSPKHDGIADALRAIRASDKQNTFLGVDLGPDVDVDSARRALLRLHDSDLGGVTTVIVLDVTKVALWGDLLPSERDLLPRAVIEPLTRWSRPALATWARHVDPPITESDPGALERIHAVTGGWPLLIDELVALRTEQEVGRWEAAVEVLRGRLAGPVDERGVADLSMARTVVAASGLVPGGVHARVFEAIVELGLDFQLQDVIAHLRDLEAFDGVDVAEVITVLDRMQVLDLVAQGEGAGDVVRAEPVLAAAWRLTSPVG